MGERLHLRLADDLVVVKSKRPQEPERFSICLEERDRRSCRKEAGDCRRMQGMASHDQKVPDCGQRYLLGAAVPLHYQDPGGGLDVSPEP